MATFKIGHNLQKMTRINVDRIKTHATDTAVIHRSLPIAIGVLLFFVGNYAILRPTATTLGDDSKNKNVTPPSLTQPKFQEYPVGRGSALDLYLDGAWQTGTVTSVQEQSRTFATILANGTIVHGISHEAFKTAWRFPCMGNKDGDKSLARTFLPNGPKTSPVPKLTDHFLDRFIVVPEYNLLFCYVEKVRRPEITCGSLDRCLTFGAIGRLLDV
jgi:hypothetical protein